MSNVIELKQVCLTLRSQVVLRDVSLSIGDNELVSVVGPSGAGKTSLLKCINRLIEPTSGSILVGGQSVRSLEPEALRRSIGYVFQGVGLFPHMNVTENITITPRLSGMDRASFAANVAKLLDLVELPQALATRMPHELSGGQRQRVGLARALAARPKIMLMDEPFGALDPVTRESLGDSFRRLHDRLGLTTMMVTHDMMEALLLSDRIIVLDQGAVGFDGSPAGLLHSQNEVAAGLVAAPRRSADRILSMMAGAARASHE